MCIYIYIIINIIYLIFLLFIFYITIEYNCINLVLNKLINIKLCMLLVLLQNADRVADTAAADADSDDESAADMEEFEESGMLDADDPVSPTLTIRWGVFRVTTLCGESSY